MKCPALVPVVSKIQPLNPLPPLLPVDQVAPALSCAITPLEGLLVPLMENALAPTSRARSDTDHEVEAAKEFPAPVSVLVQTSEPTRLVEAVPLIVRELVEEGTVRSDAGLVMASGVTPAAVTGRVTTVGLSWNWIVAVVSNDIDSVGKNFTAMSREALGPNVPVQAPDKGAGRARLVMVKSMEPVFLRVMMRLDSAPTRTSPKERSPSIIRIWLGSTGTSIPETNKEYCCGLLERVP